MIVGQIWLRGTDSGAWTEIQSNDGLCRSGIATGTAYRSRSSMGRGTSTPRRTAASSTPPSAPAATIAQPLGSMRQDGRLASDRQHARPRRSLSAAFAIDPLPGRDGLSRRSSMCETLRNRMTVHATRPGQTAEAAIGAEILSARSAKSRTGWSPSAACFESRPACTADLRKHRRKFSGSAITWRHISPDGASDPLQMPADRDERAAPAKATSRPTGPMCLEAGAAHRPCTPPAFRSNRSESESWPASVATA